MKEVSCYMCGADSRTTLFKQQGRDPYFEIVFGPGKDVDLYWHVCNHCGFVYRSPMLDEQESARLYDHYEEDVFKDCDPDEYFDRIVGLPDPESENAQKTAWLGYFLGKHAGDRSFVSMSVLDVGCGGGTLLYTLREKLGLGRLCAVELNKAYADLARRRVGIDVRCQRYRPGLFSRRFDLVVCTKVLEHLADPRCFLAAMAEDLSREGLLFLEVPDVCDLYSLPPCHERFFIPHVFYFSRNTLDVLLAGAGLEAVESRVTLTHRGRVYLQMAARRADRPPARETPYDDPVALAERVQRNMEQHMKD